MKLHTENKVVERSNVNVETQFSIKTTAKAFDILSSGLYTDSVLAIVRELSCNAYDSHVAAGKKDTPFRIHLPNEIEPFFSVRDFGTGLTHDEVMSLYTTYFESTKTDSNDFIGALGLGSKSPFSYAKAFEVIAIHNGKRRMYSAFINEHGVPSIAKMTETPTDECNGVEVKLTVKPHDHQAFRRKAEEALQWFTVQPEVVGNHTFSIRELPKTVLEGTNWKLINRNYGDDNITAIQGNVGYTVNANTISEHLDRYVLDILRNTRLILSFEIGELEVAASREEIRYDDRSVQSIVNVMNTFARELTAKVESQIDKSDTRWNKFIKLDKISREVFGNINTLRNLLKDSNDEDVAAYSADHGVLRLNYGNEDGTIFTVVRYTRKDRYSSTFTRISNVKTVSPSNDTVIFYNDMKIGGISRIKHYVETTKDINEAIVITAEKDPVKVTYSKDKQTRKSVPMPKAAIKRETDNLFNSFGGRPVLTVSKDTVKNKSASTYVKNSPFFQAKGTRELSYGGSYYNRPTRVNWRRQDHVDIEKGGLWFTLRNNTSIYRDNNQINWAAERVEPYMDRMLKLINAKHGTSWTKADVYAVSAAGEKKVDNHNKWINLFDAMDGCVEDFKNDAIAVRKVQALQQDYEVSDWFRAMNREAFVERVRGLDSNSTFRMILEPIVDLTIRANTVHEDTDFVLEYDRTAGKKIIVQEDNNDNRKFRQEVNGQIESLTNKYDMLLLIKTHFSSYNEKELDTFFGYIKSVDNA